MLNPLKKMLYIEGRCLMLNSLKKMLYIER